MSKLYNFKNQDAYQVCPRYIDWFFNGWIAICNSCGPFNFWKTLFLSGGCRIGNTPWSYWKCWWVVCIQRSHKSAHEVWIRYITMWLVFRVKLRVIWIHSVVDCRQMTSSGLCSISCIVLNNTIYNVGLVATRYNTFKLIVKFIISTW